MNVFAAAAQNAGIESSSELISFISSPHTETVDKGLELFVKQSRCLAWGKPTDDSTLKVLKSYTESFPNLDHFLKYLEEGNDSGINYALLFDAIRLLIYHFKSQQQPCHSVVSAILASKRFLYRHLHAGNHHVMATVIALYTAIASLGRASCDSVKDSFDFTMRPLEKILFLSKKLPGGEHDRTLWSLRQVYIDFILTLLENGSFEARESLSKMRTVFGNIFKQLPKDHPMMQKRVLMVLNRTILDEQSGYSMAVNVFSASNIYSIVLMNEESGDWTEYLKALLTRPGEGVCFAVEPGLHLKNRIALDLLPMLKPLESERQQDLAVLILTSCPDCTLPYLEKIKFNYEVDGSDRWSALMAFTTRILRIELATELVNKQCAEQLCLFATMPVRSIMVKCLAGDQENLLPLVYMVTVLMDFSKRFYSVLKVLEGAGEMNYCADLIKKYLQCCPDAQIILATFEKIINLPVSDLLVLIKTRLNHFMAIYGLFTDLHKFDLLHIISLAKSCQGELADSYLSLCAVLDLPKEPLQLQDLAGLEKVNLQPLFNAIIIHNHTNQVNGDEAKLERMASWANKNRKAFFDYILKGIAFKEDKAKSTNEPTITVPKAIGKRKRVVQLEDYSPRSLFMAFGKEHILRLLKSGALTNIDAVPENLAQLSECQDLQIWLRIVVKSVLDKSLIDAAFCSLQLPLAVLCMSAEQEELRLAAYAIVEQVHSALTNEDDTCKQFKERRQVRLLLDLLRNSTDSPHQQQPLPRAMFCAHALPILCSPSHPLYTALNSVLLKKAVLPKAGIPFFDQLLSGYASEGGDGIRQCLRFVQRVKEAVLSRDSEGLPDWQVARLRLLDLVS